MAAPDFAFCGWGGPCDPESEECSWGAPCEPEHEPGCPNGCDEIAEGVCMNCGADVVD